MAPLNDELLDQIDEAMVRMGRMMAARHLGPDCCPESLTLAQTTLLRALHTHGAAKMSEVAAMMAIKPPAASSAVSSLESEGYLERSHDAEDRRIIHVSLTEAGLQALQTAEAKRREVMRRYLSVLSEDDVRTLIRIHTTLINAMDEGVI